MASKNNLFKWKRQTNPTTKFKKKDKDGMSEWIEKIQTASENAAKEAFGSEIFDNSYDRSMVIPDDEAIYEAQELVSGWLQEKKVSDIQHELEFQDETWYRDTMPQKQLNDFGMNDAKSYYQELLMTNKNTNDFGIDVDDSDEDILVSEVLTGMLNKDIAKGIDIGMTPLHRQVKDPTPKMDMRHKQIKERSKARRAKEQAKVKATQSEHDVRKKAHERIQREEEERTIVNEREEQAIKEEMSRIRTELEEEKRKNEIERKRKEDIFQQAKLQMQMELRKQKEEERERKKQKEMIERKKTFEMEERIQRQTIMEMKTKMQCLHKHFAAWYNLVLEQRIGMGKARAISDWKCKLRAWNAWKAYVACVKSNEEAKAIERKMKENYRKEQMAISHFNKKLTKICLYSWLKYTRHKIEKKLLRLEHEDKAKKMALFMKNAKEQLRQQAALVEEYSDEEDHRLVNKETTSEQRQQHRATATPVTKQKQKQPKEDLNQCEDDEKYDRPNAHRNQREKQTSAVRLGLTLPGNTRKQNTNSLENRRKKQTFENKVDNSNKYNNNRESNDRSSRKDNSKPVMQEFHSDRETGFEEFQFTGRSNMNTAVGNSTKPNNMVTPRVRSEKAVTKPLHLAMEERDQRRKERRALIEVEKRRKEEEKLKELRGKQEERLRLEEEEKQERINKRKEEKRIQAEKDQEKLEQQAAYRAKLDLSKQHYQKHLLRKYGFEPLKRIVQMTALNVQLSDRYYSGILLRTVFSEWHAETRTCVEEKRRRAEATYKTILLKRSFNSWKKCRFHLQSLNKLARSFSIRRIVNKSFRAWQDYVTDERIMMWAKETDAEEHDLVRMKKKYFHEWCQFVQTEKDERIREKRRAELRKRVQTWLPDFNKT